jgi:hypothetical protein
MTKQTRKTGGMRAALGRCVGSGGKRERESMGERRGAKVEEYRNKRKKQKGAAIFTNTTVSGKIRSIRSNRFCTHQTPRSARYKLQRLPDSFHMCPLPSSVLSTFWEQFRPHCRHMVPRARCSHLQSFRRYPASAVVSLIQAGSSANAVQ